MARRGRKPNNSLDEEACPHSECPLYGMKARGNIVSNGTYRRKGEGVARRFLCRACGRSF